MNDLARKLARMIETEGPLSIAAFMTLALHDPEHRFYPSREAIGAYGAFITASEISQMFGELVGLWCAQVWQDQGSSKAARLVEFGPGRGTLMHDALRALRRVPDFPSDIVLVESSAALETLQRERLHEATVPIRWVRQWSDVASDRPLFVVANEFFDALPVRQFVMTPRGWCERMVSTDGAGRLVFALSPLPAAFAPPVGRGPATQGAVYEISSAAQALIESVSQAIAAEGGGALVIDYGYNGGGFGDTLQAVDRHQPVDILADPGEADVSVHVDFAALALSAKKGGARIHGPIGQQEFLGALGIAARAEKLAARNPDHAQEIAAALHRLTDPGEMGALFKVLAITPRDSPPPPGF